MAFLIACRLDADYPQQRIRGAVEHPNEGRHEAGKNHERASDRLGGFFRARERDGFRRQLTEYDMKEGQQKERDGNRRDVRRRRRRVESERPKELVEEMGKGRLTDPAQSQRCDGDAQLSASDVAVEMLKRRLDGPRAAIAVGDHLVELAAPGCD